MKLKIFLFTLTSFLLINITAKAQFGLAAGTQIEMADDTKKKVDNIIAGDMVLVYNTIDNVYEGKKVKSVSKVLLNRLIRVTLETGAQITMTVDYPLWAEKGWASIDPAQSMANKRYSKIQKCNIGEFLLFYNVTSSDYVEVTVVQGILDPTYTYSIELEGEGALIANGFLVGQN